MADIEKKLSLLRLVIATLMFIIVASHVWLWVWPESFSYFSTGNTLVDSRGGMDRLEPWQRIIGSIVNFLPKVFLLLVFISLYRLTRLLSSGQWFDVTCEILCQRVGKLLFAYIIAKIAQRTVLVLVITATNPKGQKELAIQFSSQDITMLMPALLSLIIGHMIQLARAQRDELNEIV